MVEAAKLPAPASMILLGSGPLALVGGVPLETEDRPYSARSTSTAGRIMFPFEQGEFRGIWKPPNGRNFWQTL